MNSLKAWQVLEERQWAPIAFARNEKGFGLKVEEINQAKILSAYAALCIAYPHPGVRGHVLLKLKEFTEDRILSNWESIPGRTQKEVVDLLKKVEGV